MRIQHIESLAVLCFRPELPIQILRYLNSLQFWFGTYSIFLLNIWYYSAMRLITLLKSSLFLAPFLQFKIVHLSRFILILSIQSNLGIFPPPSFGPAPHSVVRVKKQPALTCVTKDRDNIYTKNCLRKIIYIFIRSTTIFSLYSTYS